MAVDRRAASAFAAGLGKLAALGRAARRASRWWNDPPPQSASFVLFRGRCHEACGNGMTQRAAADHRAATIACLAALGEAARVRTPEDVTARASICVGDAEVARSASRTWLLARRRPQYEELWGAARTQGRRAAGLHAALQRGRPLRRSPASSREAAFAAS